MLLLIEDAHWIDPTTEELVGLTIEQSRNTRLLVIVSCRPEYAPPWGNHANLTRLALNRLGQRQCAELVAAVTGGRPLPPEVLAEIVLKTDDLVNRHVQSLLDLGDGAIPSLRIAPFFSRQSALIINVRGIGVLSDSNQPARDQGVRRAQFTEWLAHLQRAYTAAQAKGFLRAWSHEDVYQPLDRETALMQSAGFEVELLWRRGAFAVIRATRGFRTKID